MHAVQKANEKLGALAPKAPAAALAASSSATAFGISAGVCCQTGLTLQSLVLNSCCDMTETYVQSHHTAHLNPS